MSIPLENQLTTILTPVFGNEIYPIVHPDPDGTISEVSNLYGIFSVIGGPSFNKLDGDANISRARIQISVYSIDYTEMKAIQRAVNVAMESANEVAKQCVDNRTDVFETVGALANVSMSLPQEGREEDTKRYFSHAEYYGWIGE